MLWKNRYVIKCLGVFMKRRFLVLLLACVMVTTVFSSCVKEKTLAEYGEEVISLMVEAVGNEDYKALYGSAPHYAETIDGIKAGDYSKIKAIYELVITEEDILSQQGFDVDEESMSAELYSYICSSAYTSFGSKINIKTGDTDAIIAASIFAMQKSFVSAKDVNKIYLYVFENGTPIAVTFVSGGDRVIKASGGFIINEDFVSRVEENDRLTEYRISDVRNVQFQP